MDYNGISMTSNNYAVNDYLNLNLNIYSKDDIWNVAIKIFFDRFEERYFNPIKALMKKPKINGFAIMALNCLLIDTFYQFEEGLKETKENKNCYTSFLLTYFSTVFTSLDLATKFYKDIRCGILHSAQTQNGSMLAFENSKIAEYINNNHSIKVNVVSFSEMMHEYFCVYIKRLNDGDRRTRENFIRKMNYICNR